MSPRDPRRSDARRARAVNAVRQSLKTSASRVRRRTASQRAGETTREREPRAGDDLRQPQDDDQEDWNGLEYEGNAIAKRNRERRLRERRVEKQAKGLAKKQAAAHPPDPPIDTPSENDN